MPTMTQTTPYRDRPASEREREADCVRAIIEGAAPPVWMYEAFGGIGMLTGVFMDAFPGVSIRSAELDGACVEAYATQHYGTRATVYHGDTLDLLGQWLRDTAEGAPLWDAASLDFNRCTLLDLQKDKNNFQNKVISLAVCSRPKWIHVTDSAVGKLHLNWRSYGLRSYIDRGHALAAYLARVSNWWEERHGYRIVKSANHSAATYYRLEAI